MSVFGAKMNEKRHELTTQLVATLLNLQPEDENFSLAHDFCLQKEYYHSFADVSPSAVEAFYAALVQRLHEASQPSKAAALSSLTSSLLGSDLACSSTLELNHNLLQLLASLARQPLDSTLEETPQLLQLLYKPAEQQLQPKQQQLQQAAVSRFRQLLHGGRAAAADRVSEDVASTAGSSSEDDYDPFAEESDLTSWNSDDEQQEPQQLLPTAAALHESVHNDGGDDVDAEAERQRHLGLTSTAPVVAVHRPASALQAPAQLQPGRASPGSRQLLGRLAGARPNVLPALWPDRDHCFSERYLAQQLLRVLQGQQAHGFLLQAEQQAGPGPLVPDPRVTTPALSPGALHALLQGFAEAGSAAWQLRRLAKQLTQTRGRAWLPSTAAAAPQAATGAGSESGIAGVAVTSCLRAFGVALQQQLDLMNQQLAELQSTGPATEAASTNSSSNCLSKQLGLTLLLVQQRTRPVVRRLQLLHGTIGAVMQQLGGCPADASAALLDGLQEAASAAALTASGEQGAAHAAALLHLLLCACVPLVAALCRWLWSAGDGAPPGDSQPAAQPAAGTGGAASRRSSDDAARAHHQQEGVSCCSEDFFIVKRAAVAATDARFWHAAYDFSQRRAAACGSATANNGLGSASTGASNAGDAAVHGELASKARVACPAFLLPLASSIMAAGKSVRLLDHMEQEELRRTSFCSSSSQGSSSSSRGVQLSAPGTWLGAAAARGSSKPKCQLARSSSTGAAPQHLGRRADSSSNGMAAQRSLRAAGISSISSSTAVGRPPLNQARGGSVCEIPAAGPAVGAAAGAAGAAGPGSRGLHAGGSGAALGLQHHLQRQRSSQGLSRPT
ncbi:Spc98 family-domain-containing protein [Scenedesmus sp. NREL 46B-D3]|nr:Spc98 family-domain-containing protein [Scenedesmus sp. NREL 46B-D3]